MIYHLCVLKSVLEGSMVSELWFTWTIKVDFPCHFDPGTRPLWVLKINFVKYLLILWKKNIFSVAIDGWKSGLYNGIVSPPG